MPKEKDLKKKKSKKSFKEKSKKDKKKSKNKVKGSLSEVTATTGNAIKPMLKPMLGQTLLPPATKPIGFRFPLIDTTSVSSSFFISFSGVKVGQVYKHNKSGNIYYVTGFSKNSEDLTVSVLYQRIEFRDCNSCIPFDRHLCDFVKLVELEGIGKVPRFELISSDLESYDKFIQSKLTV